MSGRALAVLSATLDPTYSFFVPLTAQLWHCVAGFEPLVFLIGTRQEWLSSPQGRVVIEEVSHRTEPVFVPHLAGASDASLAQVVRLCAAALEGNSDDYLIVSDVDLWPLDRSHQSAISSQREFQIFNSDAYGADTPRVAMCYLGGLRSVWREIFALGPDLASSLAAIPWPADGDWHFDEYYATARLRQMRHLRERCQFLPRPADARHGRLDRLAWHVPSTLDGLVDAHLPRPGFVQDHWPSLRRLLEKLLGADELPPIDAYHARYVGALMDDTDDLQEWFKLWFRAFARMAPEPYRSYGAYGNGEPNGTACSLQAIRAFVRLMRDPQSVVLNAGAGASSFLLRKLCRNVICVDANAGYLDVVRRICVAHGLSGEGFVVGMENAPDADYIFFDYGEMTQRTHYHALAYRKTRIAIYYDDADDRPHGFPQFRALLQDFAAAQGVIPRDCREAADEYGRWGVILQKTLTQAPRGLIAFSLWGNDPLYMHGAVHNIRCAAKVYGGYRIRIYTDAPEMLDAAARLVGGDPDCDAMKLAQRLGSTLEVVPMPANVGYRGMFWRFLAASDQLADPILFRDCDSRLNPREAAAVGEWLASGKKFHVMHDHPYHADWPILGGMWGVRGAAVTDMERRIASWGVWREKTDDMKFLAARVWPEARGDVCHHSSVSTPHAPALPFPAHCAWNGFVGEIIPAV